MITKIKQNDFLMKFCLNLERNTHKNTLIFEKKTKNKTLTRNILYKEKK